MNELDALANIDFTTREEKETFRQLEVVRIGTCGGLQPYTPTGSVICSVKSIGFDGLLNFYEGRNDVCDLEFEEAFTKHLNWSPQLGAPYTIDADPTLVEQIAREDMVRGVTISCGGFFGPQGRRLRVPLAYPKQNELVESFEHNGWRITNFEMESSAVAGLSRLMGHRATTVCLVIANRLAQSADIDYNAKMKELIETVLERI
jgi:uridine phosphorylase